MSATIANTLGAVFFGIIAEAVLYGVTNLQSLIYYGKYPNDRAIHKWAVGFLWIIDTVHFAVCIHAVYFYIIESFGRPSTIIVWSFKLQSVFNVIVIMAVQALYVQRIWKLGGGKQRFIPYGIIFLMLAGAAIAVILSVLVYRVNTFAELESIAWVIHASFISATFIDVVIAAAMCMYLRQRSSFASTNSTLGTLKHYVIASGGLTSACSLGILIAFAASPHSFWFLALEFMITKLYVNSFLAMLNARQSSRSGDDLSSNGVNVSLSHISATSRPDRRTVPTRGPGQITSSQDTQSRAFEVKHNPSDVGMFDQRPVEDQKSPWTSPV